MTNKTWTIHDYQWPDVSDFESGIVVVDKDDVCIEAKVTSGLQAPTREAALRKYQAYDYEIEDISQDYEVEPAEGSDIIVIPPVRE